MIYCRLFPKFLISHAMLFLIIILSLYIYIFIYTYIPPASRFFPSKTILSGETQNATPCRTVNIIIYIYSLFWYNFGIFWGPEFQIFQNISYILGIQASLYIYILNFINLFIDIYIYRSPVSRFLPSKEFLSGKIQNATPFRTINIVICIYIYSLF